jgi:beta-carotene 3-hydroxylase
MEGVAWFSHKYIMHGLLWFLHKDHHTRETKGVLEKNDYFFFYYLQHQGLYVLFWA